MAVDIISLSSTTPYSSNDEALISSQVITSSFNPTTDYIEYIITTPNNSFQNVDYRYSGYSFPTNGTVVSSSISDIIINPEIDLTKKGFDNGEYNVYYNFYKNELNSSYDNQSFFIKSISPDRTEVVIRNVNPSSDLITQINSFKESLFGNVLYFEDFYLNFGNNILSVANNIAIDSTTLDIIINLYNPLPNNIGITTPLWIVTKISDALAFNITYTPNPVTPTILSFPLKGPNFNLDTKDLINNSTPYISYSDLITSSLLSTQYSQLSNLMSSSGVEISVDYTDFSNFVHFSSAVQRIKNFQYKVIQISSSQAEIDIINSSFSGYTTSSNVNILTNQINNIINNFDGYEYYLYYGTGSYSWPKSNSTVPYTLYSPTSAQVISWLGNENLNNPSGILGSASIYDDQNSDYLYYAIPEYLRDDPQNQPYKLFVDMVAQNYDNIWIYYKDVTNLYQADNRLDFGISKDLVAEALRSFGIKLYQNNFSSNDLYSAFLGYGDNNPNTTTSLPVTSNSGQEYISNYITSSYDASVIPLDDINKEVYKRLYHNLPYLAKTKGTIPGLRALINCFGVPDTILRISEFGGRDKDTSTYDYFDQQFNYSLNSTQSQNPVTSSFILNSNWGAGGNRPEAIQFRIKPYTYMPSDFSVQATQSLIEISGSTSGYTTNLTLWYTGSGLISGSYSGSTVDPYYQYGTLYLDIKGNLDSNYTCSIYAPFFDGNWWSIMINRSGSFGSDPSFGAHTFTLFAGSNGYYDGYDGNQIISLYSSSTTNNIPTWGYSGSKISFFDTPTSPYYPGTDYFYGDSQEIRYWAATQSIDSFKDYIMNPQSIDYTGEITYSSKLAARLPLGGDLYTGSTSVHPKITGSWVTTSSFASNSNFYIFTPSSFNTNVEARFLNSPIVGLRGRVTDKIQIVSSSLPTGSVLSQYTSIEQFYPASGSESPDVNMLEVAFSPQNEINDDIINSLGYFNIGEYIGDPRQVSSSATSYPDLNTLSNNFFQKYFDTYDLTDYVRLIKYFDNSLFKMIKDFVPARTSLTSGIVIKQHILERNKYPQPQVEWEELDYSGSIQTAFISGSTGGTFNQYNTTTFAQDWIQTYEGPTGTSYISQSSQYEFYNGELPGTEYVVTDGELNDANEFKYPSTTQNTYTPTLYISNITSLEDFLNINTSPNQGEIYLWYDTGSILNINSPGVPTAFTQG